MKNEFKILEFTEVKKVCIYVGYWYGRLQQIFIALEDCYFVMKKKKGATYLLDFSSEDYDEEHDITTGGDKIEESITAAVDFEGNAVEIISVDLTRIGDIIYFLDDERVDNFENNINVSDLYFRRLIAEIEEYHNKEGEIYES